MFSTSSLVVSFRRRVSENNFFFCRTSQPCDGYTAGLDTNSKQSFDNNVFLLVLHSREIRIDSEALIEWST